MPDDTQIAWAAGFFEGEGGIYWTPSSRATRLAVGQSEREPLERFQAIWGAGKIVPVKASPLSMRQRWVYYVQRRSEVERIFEAMRPWLGPTSIQQATRALEPH
jgi:hypothetical protein